VHFRATSSTRLARQRNSAASSTELLACVHVTCRRAEALTRLLLIASPTRSILFEQVQRRVDLRYEAPDFIALVRAGVFLEPFQEPLLSRKEFCNSCHRANAGSRMNNFPGARLFRWVT
jgi:hypothetical protein